MLRQNPMLIVRCMPPKAATTTYVDNQISASQTASTVYVDNLVASSEATTKTYTDNQVATSEASTKTYVDNQLASNGMPAGAVTAFNLSSCPSGWLAADGDSGRPDLRGMFIRGLNNFGTGKRNDGKQDPDGDGRSLRSFQWHEMQSHKHNDSGHKHTYYSFQSNRAGNASSNDGYARTSMTRTSDTGKANLGDPTNSGTGAGSPRHGDETRPKNVSLIYCVKS